MTYTEAKKLLDENKEKVPTTVSLFIAPKDKQSGETNLKSCIGEDDNKLALKKFGFLDNDDLEVYVTYEADGKIYYPGLSDYFQMLPKSNTQ